MPCRIARINAHAQQQHVHVHEQQHAHVPHVHATGAGGAVGQPLSRDAHPHRSAGLGWTGGGPPRFRLRADHGARTRGRAVECRVLMRRLPPGTAPPRGTAAPSAPTTAAPPGLPRGTPVAPPHTTTRVSRQSTDETFQVLTSDAKRKARDRRGEASSKSLSPEVSHRALGATGRPINAFSGSLYCIHSVFSTRH